MRAFRLKKTGLWSLLIQHANAVVPKQSPSGPRLQGDRNLLVQRTGSTTSPAPIIAEVSQFWEGNDGLWSSFVLQIGPVNSSQEVRVLPSTASTSTWVVKSIGCDDVPIANCEASRGKFFNRLLSTSWASVSLGKQSIFELGIEDNLLGEKVNGEFGWDSVSLGWAQSGGVTALGSVIAGIGDHNLTWLGILGLNPRPTNFTGLLNEPQESFIQKLKDQGNIPSLSWSYTAGARYKGNSNPTGVFGSLVLGGYDSTRFSKPSTTDPSLTFRFDEDISRDLLVGISSISTNNVISSTANATLLNNPIFAFLDSTVAHIWLPEDACKAFENAFGLTWNSDTGLYTLSGKQHDALSQLNPSITFKLSPSLPPKANDKSVNITLPYAAFDLNVSYPFGGGSSKNESVYYFPLKRAKDDTQYTLGRAFFQEAYLIADYERNNFSIWPCRWDADTTSPTIATISSINPIKRSSIKKNLGAGVIAGIAIGGAAAAIAIGVAIYFTICRMHRKEALAIELQRAQTNSSGGSLPAYQHQHRSPSTAELASTAKHELHEDHRFEAPGGGKFEMDGEGRPHEADANEKVVHEMDAGGDGIGGMHGVTITFEPATAISPKPASTLPLPTIRTSIRESEDSEKELEVETQQKVVTEKEVTEEKDEKDGVRSFFGFLKAFRASGRN